MQRFIDWSKIVLGFALCFAFRLIPVRPPNVEPLLATQMPFAKVYGPYIAFMFGFLSIVLFDLVTMHVGMWTLITAFAYGLLGVVSVLFFKNREMKRINYVKFAVIGTIFYDALTGLTVGPLFFNQSFMNALIGQIPFTILHLAGSVAFAITLSPLIHTYITTNKVVERYIGRMIFNSSKI